MPHGEHLDHLSLEVHGGLDVNPAGAQQQAADVRAAGAHTRPELGGLGQEAECAGQLVLKEGGGLVAVPEPPQADGPDLLPARGERH